MLIQNFQGEHVIAVNPRKVEQKKEHVGRPEQPGRRGGIALIQPAGDDIDGQGHQINQNDTQKSPVHPDRKPRTQKIIT